MLLDTPSKVRMEIFNTTCTDISVIGGVVLVSGSVWRVFSKLFLKLTYSIQSPTRILELSSVCLIFSQSIVF